MLFRSTLDDAMPRATIRVPFGFALFLASIWALTESYAQKTLGSVLTGLFGS